MIFWVMTLYSLVERLYTGDHNLNVSLSVSFLFKFVLSTTGLVYEFPVLSSIMGMK
jgi:hypothetical protein